MSNKKKQESKISLDFQNTYLKKNRHLLFRTLSKINCILNFKAIYLYNGKLLLFYYFELQHTVYIQI